MMKDPDARLDFSVDWTDWLAEGEQIVESTWVIVKGTATAETPTHTATAATIWLSGGVEGEKCTARNRIVTNQGRTDDRSISDILIAER